MCVKDIVKRRIASRELRCGDEMKSIIMEIVEKYGRTVETATNMDIPIVILMFHNIISFRLFHVVGEDSGGSMILNPRWKGVVFALKDIMWCGIMVRGGYSGFRHIKYILGIEALKGVDIGVKL